MRRLNLSIAAASLVAMPAYAETVYYHIYLAGPGQNTLVMKVDTGAMPKNGVIRPAPFTAIIRRNDGTLVPQYYRFSQLESGKVYKSQTPHGVAGARSVSASDISWAINALGKKADGLEMAAATDDISAALVDPPPAIITHCKAYTQIAIQQFYDARNRQCGFGGNRWSPNYQHHYQWCVGVLVPELNGETQARATAISQCAHK